MIIDAHQHFWDKDKFNYPWLTPKLKGLYRNFLPEHLRLLIEKNDVSYTVVVQAMSSSEETRWLLDLARQYDFIGGVVGWVDLADDKIEENLAELLLNPKFKGIRHQVENEPDREWLIRDNVLQGLEKVASFGLGYDALLAHDQLWQLDIVMKRCPSLRIVIDHCSKPDIVNGEFEGWAQHLTEAAKHPVYCKLSGLITEADHEKWTLDELKLYANHIIDAFGPSRIIFGSDWPVSTMASEYSVTIKTYMELISGLNEKEKADILHYNAIEFYKLY